MNLCAFSSSLILRDQVLESCPLELNRHQSKTCECRRRVSHVPPCDLRVLSCTWPTRWDGRPLAGERNGWLKSGVENMSTAVLEGPPDKAKAATNGAAPSGGIWCGLRVPVLGVTGEKFSGKTLFVASIDPAHTCMIDLEDSSESYSIEFAKRVSLYDEMLQKHGRVASPLEAFAWFSAFVEAIKPKQYTVLAVDPLSDIETGLVDWVRANPAKFGHTAIQYEKASGLLWADVKSHWKMMLGIISRKVETFAFTTHMGNVFKGGAPTGKRAPKGKETLFELASLYLELQRKPDDKGRVEKKPTATVLKSRLAISREVNGDWDHTPILPPRLPVATPAAIRDYIRTPPDYAKLKKGELAETERLSDDEKLEIQREIAATQLETEQIRLSAMDRLKEQVDRQDSLRRRQAAAAAAVVKPESAEGAATTTASTPGATEAAPFDAAEVMPAEPSVYEIIESQKKQLGISDDQWKTILAKRSVTQTKDLTPAQAEEIRVALWGKLTKRDMATASHAAPAKRDEVPF